MARSNVIQFRVPDELADELEELVTEAQNRGVANATKNKVARALLQAAMDLPPKQIVAFEALIDAYAVKQQLNNKLGELIADNLDDLLGGATS